MDLLCEQVKMLAGEVALSTSSLKRISEQAASNPEDSRLQDQMQKLKDEITEKKHQMRVLEQRMIGSVEITPQTSNSIEMSQLGFGSFVAHSSLCIESPANFKIKTGTQALQSNEPSRSRSKLGFVQLVNMISDNAEMQETILLLRQQLDSLVSDKNARDPKQYADNEVIALRTCSTQSLGMKNERMDGVNPYREVSLDEHTPTSVMSLNRIFSPEESKESSSDAFWNSQLLMQATEIEILKQEKVKLAEEKDGLEIHNQKLAEEALYAKELAAAAAVELRNLAEEVTKLSYQNTKLTADLDAVKEACCKTNCCQRSISFELNHNGHHGSRPDAHLRKPADGVLIEELEQELNGIYQREASLVAALTERDQVAGELRKRIDEAKQREEDLENELANMWVLVAKLQKSVPNSEDALSEGVHASNILQTRVKNGFSSSNGYLNKIISNDEIIDNMDEASTLEELKELFHKEKKRCEELESFISRLKGDDIAGLDITTLEELQSLHVEAITKICYAKGSCTYSTQIDKKKDVEEGRD
ncbi:unnamed protein product [Ilex paraguariensis]|uniref:Uncharacterized protein n=1 Tax=Ilex paraguariensis TaxID=185542 RepID=A0ABC8TN14_9AQUA